MKMIPWGPGKIDRAAGFLLAAAVAAAYVLLFHQGISRFFYLRTQESMLKKNLGAAASLAHDSREIRSEIADIEHKLAEYNSRLPREKNIDDILRQIHGAAARAGMAITLIEPYEMQHEEMVSRLPFKIACSGSFAGSFAFFGALERLPRILRFNRVIIRKQEGATALDIEVEVAACVLN